MSTICHSFQNFGERYAGPFMGRKADLGTQPPRKILVTTPLRPPENEGNAPLNRPCQGYVKDDVCGSRTLCYANKPVSHQVFAVAE